jgi:hypothetical protein
MTSSSYADFSAIAWEAGAVITFMETMTLLASDRRVRSTHALKDGRFDGISFIEEIRVSEAIA